ncbi:MAG: NADAR family protein, partial [Candidatus Hermodarchaeia archaeon]
EKFTLFWAGPFSQWLRADMEIDGVFYNCCEQYMMAEKARLFGDQEALEQIMATSEPKEQKAWGRKVQGFVKEEWERIEENGKPFCWNAVYKANYHKFTQNKGLRHELFSTAGTTLVEASPYDDVWGIKLGEEDPRALDRSQWQGTNWLGEVLTQLREDLMEEQDE